MSAWQFKPRLLPTLAVIFLLPLLLSLGFWQLHRADQKQARYAQFQARRAMAPFDLSAAAPEVRDGGSLLWRRVTAQGVYDGRHYLLDNQIFRGDAGYYVYSTFSLMPGGERVLVNRGWVPIGPDRARPPPLPIPQGSQRISGVIKEAPAPALLLSKDTWEDLGGGVARLQDLDMKAIEKHSGHALLPFIIRLDANAPSGFARHWVDPGSGKEMHLGYAFQWFMLSAVLAIIYLALNLKKNPHAQP